MPTTGLSKAARIHVSSTSPTLVLVGASQQLTSQISATAQDVAGNTVSGTLYYSSADPSVASVSTSGLITAHEPGITQIEVSTPAFGQSPTVLGPDGTPINGKVYALVNVAVQQGVPVLPSFSFSLSASSVTISPTGSASVTITQTVANGDPGPVTYSFYANLPNVPSLNGTGAILNWADSSLTPTINFSFSNNVSGNTTRAFAVQAGMFGRTTTRGTYKGWISGAAQHYSPNAPAGSPTNAGGGGVFSAGNTQQPATFQLPFTVVVS